jgi:hypothetical protein
MDRSWNWSMFGWTYLLFLLLYTVDLNRRSHYSTHCVMRISKQSCYLYLIRSLQFLRRQKRSVSYFTKWLIKTKRNSSYLRIIAIQILFSFLLFLFLQLRVTINFNFTLSSSYLAFDATRLYTKLSHDKIKGSHAVQQAVTKTLYNTFSKREKEREWERGCKCVVDNTYKTNDIHHGHKQYSRIIRNRACV